MQKRFHKYFWDAKNFDTMSPIFALQRILEYSSFPDLIKYPFSEFKNHISEIRIDKMWTDEMRKKFIKALLPCLPGSNSWDELFEKFIASQRLNLKNASHK